MTKTKFHGKNPFTGQTAGAVNVSALKICDDPIPTVRTPPVSKYDDVFKRLKVGQCIKCQPNESAKIKAALDKWLSHRNLDKTHHTKASVRYPTDGLGRVWLLERDGA